MKFCQLAHTTINSMKVLIPVPQFQYIFNWTVVDSSGFIKMLHQLIAIDEIEIILKFHPRHGRIEHYSGIVDLSKFNVQNKDNFMEVLEEADIVVAFESSSVLVDSILGCKPLIYVKDFMEQFNDEYVYKELISNFSSVDMLGLAETLSRLKKKEIQLDDFLPKLKLDDVLYNKGEAAANSLVKEISKILDRHNT